MEKLCANMQPALATAAKNKAGVRLCYLRGLLIQVTRTIAVLSAALLSQGVIAGELSEEEAAAAKRRRAEAIAMLEASITDLEKQKSTAVKADDRITVRSLLADIKAARLALFKAKKKTLEEFAADIASDAAKAKVEEEQKRMQAEQAKAKEKEAAERAQVEQAAAQRRAELERAAKLREQEAEAERLEQSGGCPLKLTRVNFYHADVDSIRRGARLSGARDDIPKHLHGEVTFVSCGVQNCIDAPIEAHELLVQFINGFDEVIEEHILQGTLLTPGERRVTSNGWPKVETATQVRVVVERTKLADDQRWERRAEHKHVSLSAKKPEGAELGK